MQKIDKVPDHIEFEDDGQISLVYGDITVKLGKDEYLEDKMTRVLAILPMISEKKGILHAENVNDNSKNITLEQEQDESQTSAENWTGGYDGGRKLHRRRRIRRKWQLCRTETADGSGVCAGKLGRWL